MKLITVLTTRKATALIAFIMLTLAVHAGVAHTSGIRRVFWNKFEVVATEKNAVILTWNVTEYNNKSFRVQHSTDGLKWEDIALVQTKNSGTGESMADYTYTHLNGKKGKHFYRLEDVDVDATSIGMSPVKTLVLYDEKPLAAVWPNPANSEISVARYTDNSSNSKAQIFDLSGRMLVEKQFGGEHSTTININDLQPGTYVMRVQGENGKIHTEKFVKQ
jgi:Secretion system C-terminal sorting domain